MTPKELYDIAYAHSQETYVTKSCEVGSVGCALETETGHVYFGTNMDMSCSLGMCAERNAISTMITHEVSKIKQIICVHKSGKIIPPCGACREFMRQLGDICIDTKIITSIDPLEELNLKTGQFSWWRDELKK